jgi:membrane fusion protein (multidrug efflux system)
MKSRVSALATGAAVAGIAVVALWALGVGPRQPQAAPAATPAAAAAPLEFMTQEVVRPGPAVLARTVEFSGPLVAPSTAVVRARATGRLQLLAVAEGAQVAAGQVLGRLDLADQAGRAAERAAFVESARAALAQAERVQAQNERLAAQGFISGAARDTSLAAVQTARAQLDAAVAALATAQAGLRDGALVAPIGGIVARRHALQGEAVSAEQPVLTLVDLSRLELAGVVATHEVSRLTAGMTVNVRVEGHDEPLAGRIARIAPSAEPGTRAIGVTVSLANPAQVLRAGQFALASVTLADAPSPRVLPVAAIGTTSGQPHVWTIRDGALARRAVTLGRRDEAGGRVEVLDGVDVQDLVLAARFDNLREGTPAVVRPAHAAAGAASAAASAASRSR